MSAERLLQQRACDPKEVSLKLAALSASLPFSSSSAAKSLAATGGRGGVPVSVCVHVCVRGGGRVERIRKGNPEHAALSASLRFSSSSAANSSAAICSAGVLVGFFGVGSRNGSVSGCQKRCRRGKWRGGGRERHSECITPDCLLSCSMRLSSPWRAIARQPPGGGWGFGGSCGNLTLYLPVEQTNSVSISAY